MDKNHDLGILCTLQPLDLKGKSPRAQVTNLSSPSPACLASLGGRWKWWEGAAGTPQDLSQKRVEKEDALCK